MKIQQVDPSEMPRRTRRDVHPCTRAFMALEVGQAIQISDAEENLGTVRSRLYAIARYHGRNLRTRIDSGVLYVERVS